MKRLLWLFLVGAAALPQEYPEYSGWMKNAGAAFGALGKLERKTGTEAVGGAEQLGRVYENMIGFWRQRGADDPIKWSQQGKAAAVQLAAAAHAGDAEAAGAAFQALGATCHSCHQAYREKLPDGKYRFKTPPQPEK